MKICPFCKEEVRDEAIKCRYCQSMLLPGLAMPLTGSAAEVTTPVLGTAGGVVTYIVDEGIIKFGKFAAAVLALFLVIGLYLFGINVDKTLERMNEAKFKMDDADRQMKVTTENLADSEKSAKDSAAVIEQQLSILSQQAKKIKELEDSAKKTGSDIVGAKNAIDLQVSQTQRVLRQSEANAASNIALSREATTNLNKAIERADRAGLAIEADRVQFRASYDAALLRLDPAGQERLAEQKRDSPTQFRSTLSDSKLWPNGAMITVGFLDGTEKQKSDFRAALELWREYVNLKFQFASDGDAQIRVSFARQGSWSYLGTDALAVDQASPTINLGFARPDGQPPPNYIHEIGHVLGLVHEFTNPDAKLEFDKPYIYNTLSGPPNNWSHSHIDNTVFLKLNEAQYPGKRPFDRFSVMNLAFPAKFFKNGIGIGQTITLSESDKNYVRMLYPR